MTEKQKQDWKIIEEATQLLERRGGWTTGAEGKPIHGGPSGGFSHLHDPVDHDEDDPRFYETEKMRYCAIGAIFAAAGKEEESRAHELIRELDFLVSEYTDGQFDCVVDFNDESNDKRRVVKMFKRMLRKKKAEAGIPIELPESRKDSADSGAVTEQEEPVSV